MHMTKEGQYKYAPFSSFKTLEIYYLHSETSYWFKYAYL